MTQVKALVSTGIKAVNITELNEGDIYKRIIPNTSYQSARVVVGIVKGIAVSNDDVCFQCLEMSTGFGRYETSYVAFSSYEDILITKCSVEEFNEAKSIAIASLTKTINQYEKSVEEARAKLEVVNRLDVISVNGLRQNL